MLAIGFFVVIVFTALFAIYLVRDRHYGIGVSSIGTVESIRLTFGQQGQQILTIDGIEYNVWLNFSEFYRVEKGNVVEHEPFWDTRVGRKLLSTKLIRVVQYKKKKNAAPTQPSRQVPA